jgi:hypothetical protein
MGIVFQYFDLKTIYIKRPIYSPHVVSKVSVKKNVMSIDGQSKDNVRSSLRPEIYLNILFLFQRKNTATPGLEQLGLRTFRLIICEKPTIHINTLCGQNARLLMWKSMLHIVTTVLYKHVVWQCAVSDLQP